MEVVCPRSTTCPAVGRSRAHISRPTVVLPHPDSPTSPKVSPLRITNPTPDTALTVPTERRNTPPPRTGNSFTRRSARKISLCVDERSGPLGRRLAPGGRTATGTGEEPWETGMEAGEAVDARCVGHGLHRRLLGPALVGRRTGSAARTGSRRGLPTGPAAAQGC